MLIIFDENSDGFWSVVWKFSIVNMFFDKFIDMKVIIFWEPEITAQSNYLHFSVD
ncbi:hypothetical Protein YC6258_01033 [Gynuella sunshinyii YC6258]|uniref:Uncharacterized protein n=1 Tax=Gynuella sunshinyii YC6258 TaxID=1445510 RepID=A0A0C5VIA1_9GAMM|nr:hypothetical Protein YC6258_01033 [Gynuella sunshinyii YC6258]